MPPKEKEITLAQFLAIAARHPKMRVVFTIWKPDAKKVKKPVCICHTCEAIQKTQNKNEYGFIADSSFCAFTKRPVRGMVQEIQKNKEYRLHYTNYEITVTFYQNEGDIPCTSKSTQSQ